MSHADPYPPPPAPPSGAGRPRPRPAGQGRFVWQDFDSDWSFTRKTLIVLALLGLAFLAWKIAYVLLLVFAAALLAILLRGFANLIARHTPVPGGWSLTLATLVAALTMIAFFTLFGAQISEQTSRLVQRLPEALDTVGARIGVTNAARRVEAFIASEQNSSLVSRVAGIGGAVFGAVADLLIVIVSAIYLAADPQLYRRGAAKLLPPEQHARFNDAMSVTGRALQLWFRGQLVSMTMVGIISGLAFWIIGLPSPVALGLFAAIADFIPVIGPVLGAVPAIIFALNMDLQTVVWTLLAVVVIQQIEGNLIVPLVQQRIISLPPALSLFAIVAFGLLFGVLGVFLAVPLTVALTVLVKKLWVRETLGEQTEVPGEAGGTATSEPEAR